MGLKTPLFDLHQAAGAKIVDFAGWDMPLHYGSQIAEHSQTRQQASIFDVSHMRSVDLEGPGALRFLEILLANDPIKLARNGQALYSCLLNESGGVIDDLIVYRLGEQQFRLVVNAANAAKDLSWLTAQKSTLAAEVQILERTDLSMIAIQGPAARAKFWQAQPAAVTASIDLKSFEAAVFGEWLISRTGYTGEDGFEVMLPAAEAPVLWQALAATGAKPAGLGARDSLRLEAGLNLCGNDMDEAVSPIAANLAWTVDLKRPRPFIGRAALEAQPPTTRLLGIRLLDRGILRTHTTVETNHGPGELTSGGFSPVLNQSIGMARVPQAAKPGDQVTVVIRGQGLAAELVKMPFVRHGRSRVTEPQAAAVETPFTSRHIGPTEADQAAMLAELNLVNREDLIAKTVPSAIRHEPPTTWAGQSEAMALEHLSTIAQDNQVAKSFIGLGYYGTITPPVIQRNVLENPGWYTAYTPYQAEISQGRLESLINWQEMVCDLTGMEVANASLLDEATAAAEALTMAKRVASSASDSFFVDEGLFPQTIAVLKTRAEWLGLQLVIGPRESALEGSHFGAVFQYPDRSGAITDLTPLLAQLKARGTVTAVGTDLLALVLLRSPGDMGADIVYGSSQRFGVPMGNGGPHAAFFATRQSLIRSMPGRIIGVSRDSRGQTAFRMTLQTREQHIRREKATSNICTSQVLLANMAAMYAVWHGPEGLSQIASRVHHLARVAASSLQKAGFELSSPTFFDSFDLVTGSRTEAIYAAALKKGYLLRQTGPQSLGLSFDESHRIDHLKELLACFGATLDETLLELAIPEDLARRRPVLAHPVFSRYHSEHAMTRYLRQLQAKDIALDRSMIPLGSCTMKLNPSAAMAPISWPQFAAIHPLAPLEHRRGYQKLITELSERLAALTGFDQVSFQPNSGAQGEYAGLVAIRHYHRSRNQGHRRICLIPTSAHGTNPASAQLCGLDVVPIACEANGNVSLDDLRAKAAQHKENLAALMITYPSTHGVFEPAIKEICALVHEHGGQVYMDGANLNAQVGLTSPGFIGADVAHLNLHKTFAIPHGGGGPGAGPVAVKQHLVPFLPGTQASQVAAAPNGSALILTISWMYLELLGSAGVRQASEVAILSANYIAHKLHPHFPVLYTGETGMVAHECIIDLRPIKLATGGHGGISETDVAKRLIDYGFHAPTVSFPVPGTMMIEPTESESKAELDRFIEAMIQIREEIRAVERGAWPLDNNPLKNAPHTQDDLCAETWDHPYSREVAAFPLPWIRANKYWSSVNRIDDVYGDRNIFCSCPPMTEY